MTDFSFFEVVAIPVKGAAGDETGEEIISSNGSAAADEEEAEGGGEKDVGFAVNQFAVVMLV